MSMRDAILEDADRPCSTRRRMGSSYGGSSRDARLPQRLRKAPSFGSARPTAGIHELTFIES